MKETELGLEALRIMDLVYDLIGKEKQELYKYDIWEQNAIVHIEILHKKKKKGGK